VFSSVNPSDRTRFSPVWARILRRTRLENIVRSSRAVLDWISVSQYLNKYLDSLLTLQGTVDSKDGGNQTLVRKSYAPEK